MLKRFHGLSVLVLGLAFTAAVQAAPGICDGRDCATQSTVDDRFAQPAPAVNDAEQTSVEARIGAVDCITPFTSDLPVWCSGGTCDVRGTANEGFGQHFL